MVSKLIKIENKSGLNVKSAGVLVKTVRPFKCAVKLKFEDKEINAKSILGIMSAAVKCGDTVEFVCSGSDEQEALNAVAEIAASGFKS